MKQSLTKLVNVILQRIQDQPETRLSESGIRTWLVRQGYAKRDIDAAIKMMRPRFASLPHIREGGPGRIRHLSDYERYKLSDGARNALVRLELYELIDPSERELLLERLDQFEGEIGVSELDYLLSWLILPGRDVEYQQTIYNILDGNDLTLH